MPISRTDEALREAEVIPQGPDGEVHGVRSSVGKLRLPGLSKLIVGGALLMAGFDEPSCECGIPDNPFETSADTDGPNTGTSDTGEESVDETGNETGSIALHELCSEVGMESCYPTIAFRSAEDNDIALTKNIDGKPNKVVQAVADETNWHWSRAVLAGSNLYGIEESENMTDDADVPVVDEDGGVVYTFGYMRDPGGSDDCSNIDHWSVDVQKDGQPLEVTQHAFPYGDYVTLMAGAFDIEDTGNLSFDTVYTVPEGSNCDFMTYLVTYDDPIPAEDEGSYVFAGADGRIPRFLIGEDRIGDSVEGYFGGVAMGGIQTGQKVEN